MCDLDRFKLINDSLGHRAGDELLQEVARRLSTVVRTADTVARFGGDEFVSSAPPIGDAEDAAELASRVMEALQAPMRIAGIDIHISPSIGIAMYPDDGSHGRRCSRTPMRPCTRPSSTAAAIFRRYSPGMHAGSEDRVHLESDLHNAVVLSSSNSTISRRWTRTPARCAAPRR